ncbi:unnamed protein product [Periconia digitata]|uniref:Aminotransferase class I/classII large domain-containing protein n=1 Tax=Periconia digitata TaxID=1303443 RepID=A0A9W4UE86_9PLEO|nr:unnamed protein product [Periconia digitata]
MEGSGLSTRGAANVSIIWPKIANAVAEREEKGRSKENTVIDLSTSENWLIRDELIEFYKTAIQSDLAARHFSYPDGFNGDQCLVNALAEFFNVYFKPHSPVLVDHISVAPGAASALDSLLYNICEAGDGLLVPAPFWNGFDWLLNVKAGVFPIAVSTETFDNALTMDLLPMMEEAFANSSRPIKGVLFTNPHNPFGRCYPSDVIVEVIKFCNKKNIHFISDELYAVSRFESPDVINPEPFVSALELDLVGAGCDPSRVHIIWSISKDLGSSGLRMGCCVTQNNRPLATGMSLTSSTQLSSLTAIAASALLTSPKLPQLIKLNSQRLSIAYSRLTSFLKEHNIEYIPATNGPFLFCKIVADARTWEDEAEFVSGCKKKGVSISAGKSYHVNVKGWARINFAIMPEEMSDALTRLSKVIS